jgi:hypothetical protein
MQPVFFLALLLSCVLGLSDEPVRAFRACFFACVLMLSDEPVPASLIRRVALPSCLSTSLSSSDFLFAMFSPFGGVPLIPRVAQCAV